MIKKNKTKKLLFFVIGVLIISSFSYFLVKKHFFTNNKCDNLPIIKNNTNKFVTKVISGDSFIIQGGLLVKIIGIDAGKIGDNCTELFFPFFFQFFGGL